MDIKMNKEKQKKQIHQKISEQQQKAKR